MLHMSTAPRIAAAKRDWGHDERGCTVLHIDMDAFFASLEIARHPELANRPVIVGTGNRAVVSAANYEARTYGINSAMPASRAHQLCPNGVFLPVDHHYYSRVSREIFGGIFSQVTDRIEQVSVDECYMDVAGALLEWRSPTRIGAWLREQVRARYHITCSVGVASNKLVAKMASTNAKPDGLLLIPVARQAEFVQMMPLRGIPGIGPSLERRLNEHGVDSVRALAQIDLPLLETMTNSRATAQRLHDAARGLDSREIVTHTPEKSIGAEHTFEHDVTDAAEVCALLRRCCDDVASTLRRKGFVARTVTVKLRFPDLSVTTKSLTIEQPTDAASALLPVTFRLLRAMLGIAADAAPTRLPRAIRLAGMSVSSLAERTKTVVQPTIDDMLAESGVDGHTSSTQTRLRGAEETLDAIRSRFGADSARLGI
ncbi:DNA polymerase IV [Bifidobacterium criceti]|uniref:DNA polymerase IV n=2 Tax=Bifidobacterium criceti TaxID=1960969 RepID=A0A2A2EHU0_9BIFI|nr:DNA polymerase IV [Bifidobacterium criceti]